MSESRDTAALDRTALEALSEMTGGDEEFLAELIHTFLDDGAKLLTDMETAAADQNAVDLRRAAHTLKSNCRTFGATALGDVCQTIEEHAANDKLDEAAGLIEQAQAQYPAVVAALQAERKES